MIYALIHETLTKRHEASETLDYFYPADNWTFLYQRKSFDLNSAFHYYHTIISSLQLYFYVGFFT